jgi:hypothetical protein
MGYQPFSGIGAGPRPDAPLSRRLSGGAASPRRAWTARHEFDSRMGYQPLSGTGAGPRPDAALSRRLPLGVDGRHEIPAVFDGVNPAKDAAVPLKLKSVERRENDTLWILYEVLRSCRPSRNSESASCHIALSVGDSSRGRSTKIPRSTSPTSATPCLGHTSSGAEELAKMIPKARVVCAFNTVPSEVLFGVYEARRRATRPSLVYCGVWGQSCIGALRFRRLTGQQSIPET